MLSFISNTQTKIIANKVINNERISPDDALFLFEKMPLHIVAYLADIVNVRINQQNVWFNRNFHLEPTNICIHNCKFCSYSRKKNQDGAWEHSIKEMLEIAAPYKGSLVTEVHIVGGVHPERNIDFYGELIYEIKKLLPGIHVKAFTAVELDHMIKKSGLSVFQGLKKLKEYGLDSIPGGGAEIFNSEIRKQICHEKSNADTWLNIHRQAHLNGIPSNATILYGHIENYAHRVEHLGKLRELQDYTHGFNAFIPLKYKNRNNLLSHIKEAVISEDLRNYAVSRIFLDNIPHIKAYWPMTGKEMAQLALEYGVDDLDGTIDDSTKIYSMAGSVEQKPEMTAGEMIELIKNAGKVPVERDSLYNIIRKY
ncbi:MAG: aminofutalosine synthase MqnE [Bacteroidales bacterium]|nr:aminofutalosine synthase MqnE [Bacteroidales bacterium]